MFHLGCGIFCLGCRFVGLGGRFRGGLGLFLQSGYGSFRFLGGSLGTGGGIARRFPYQSRGTFTIFPSFSPGSDFTPLSEVTVSKSSTPVELWSTWFSTS